ncbi:hypothetical protein [Streptomyces sp. TBY4]|uniref:hypothetical protein n=1 Tax=Streptomyces sp. TBY4 TaxID=2962030 RepID=UPI0020B71BED|nr:hypothetical protein [Streptomyces sp. TBY4]MCP3755207.1 hypothetical protein [Streptomyces sp. TBY4]
MGFWDWLFGRSNVTGKSGSDDIPGVYGGNDANGNGVVGETNGTGFGVFGQSKNGVGVAGKSFTHNMAGVHGENDSQGPGVEGEASGAGPGVVGQSASGDGVQGRSHSAHTYGVVGVTFVGAEGSKESAGVRGEPSQSGFGYGVWGHGVREVGIFGESEKKAGGKFVGVTGVECTAKRDGQGKMGPGIVATSADNIGGKFTSSRRGQIQLVPRVVEFGTGDQGSYPKLPKFANPGELIMVTRSSEPPLAESECSLWLCVASAPTYVSARWARVQLGSEISGEA